MQSAPATYAVHATLGKGWTGWKAATVSIDPETGITVRTARGQATATADEAALDVEPYGGNLVLAHPQGDILATLSFSSPAFIAQDLASAGMFGLLILAWIVSPITFIPAAAAGIATTCLFVFLARRRRRDHGNESQQEFLSRAADLGFGSVGPESWEATISLTPRYVEAEERAAVYVEWGGPIVLTLLQVSAVFPYLQVQPGKRSLVLASGAVFTLVAIAVGRLTPLGGQHRATLVVSIYMILMVINGLVYDVYI